jgi:hypothetical protein
MPLPPVPPYHRIDVPWRKAWDLMLSDAGRESLVDGVEVYMNISDFGGILPFFRGVMASTSNGIRCVFLNFEGNHWLRRVTPFMQLIPAELVDAGLLGPENVLRTDP